MTETHHAASTVEKTSEFRGAEGEDCRIGNKPGNKVHTGTHLYIGFPSDRGVSVKLSRNEHKGLNEAVIVLSLEEVQRLTRALIEHPILLPTSYSQNLSVENGKHSLRITSEESFADFVERLSDALGMLPRKK